MMKSFAVIAASLAIAAAENHCEGACQSGENVDSIMMKRGAMAEKARFWEEYKNSARYGDKLESLNGKVDCINGKAGEYDCDGVDMLSFISLEDLRPKRFSDGRRAGNSNDIWGWIDPVTQKEYAIICLVDGTSFVDVSDYENPKVVAWLEDTLSLTTSWRDAKVYNDHVYIGSENNGSGIQVYDLTGLRTIEPTPTGDIPDIAQSTVGEGPYFLKAFYDEFGSSHNMVINEKSGVLYAVGTKTCRGGLHMVDIKEADSPKFLGCYSEDGYTHDSECVIYEGPDVRFTGREICFNYNEDTLTIVDVEDKNNLVQLARVPYGKSQYTHQGWLTGDSRHLLMNDELDEVNAATEADQYTRTMVWNVDRLDEPRLVSSFYSEEKSIDHNLYIRDDIGYLSNYSSGLRIMNTTVVDGTVSGLGYFDVCPTSSAVEFLGTWSNFPWYSEKGVVAVSSIERGLFMLKVQPRLLN